jgi:hypothetical protein
MFSTVSTTAYHLPYSEPDKSIPHCFIVSPFISSKLVPIFLSLVAQRSSKAEILCNITWYVDFLRWDISAHRPPPSWMTTLYQLSVTVYSIHSQLLSMFRCRLLHPQTEDTPWCLYRDPLNKGSPLTYFLALRPSESLGLLNCETPILPYRLPSLAIF